MQPLEIAVAHYGTHEELKDNISHALSLGLPELGLTPCCHDGTFVVVGSGPSLPKQINRIEEERIKGRPICAINGAHDFLCDNEIIPDLFLTTDPREMPHNFKRKNKKTNYLIASRCHPKTFELLKDCNVTIWHAWMDKPETDHLIGMDKIAIGGGTTSGLRAITLSYVLGFRKAHLYGFDSCLDGKMAKRWDSGPLGSTTKTTDVIVGDQTFICNLAMAQQARDFQDIYDIMPDVHIEAFGGGLISAIIEERKKQNLPT